MDKKELDEHAITVPTLMVHIAWSHNYMGKDLIRTAEVKLSNLGNKLTPEIILNWIKANSEYEGIFTNVIGWQVYENID